MTQLMEEQTHLSNFERFAATVPAAGANGSIPSWLDDRRRAAIARFDEVGFPGRKQEGWRHTNVTPIANAKFALAGPLEASDAAGESVAQYTFGNDAVAELVFINGHFSLPLSRIGKLPRGVQVGSLADGVHAAPALLEKHLARHAKIDGNPFVALNTGFLNDGAYIHVPRNAAVEGPIHLLFVSTGSGEATVSHPRVLIVAEDGSDVTLVESFVGTDAAADSAAHFTNPVTEVYAGANCRVDHNKLQHDTDHGYHVSTTQVRLGRDSRFISHVATLGGRLTRNDLNVVLAEPGADATLNGVVLLGGTQHCDNHTLLDHAAPNCQSHELYKHVLDAKATGVFKGKILVRQPAQKTDSKQSSKSLLLSEEATMHSQPALEIYADDVKCTHGSTTGPVDEEQVFYLRSRGVTLAAARHLMTYAFAADVTRRIKVEPVRRRLENYMAAQHGLPLDLRISDIASHDDAAVNM